MRPILPIPARRAAAHRTSVACRSCDDLADARASSRMLDFATRNIDAGSLHAITLAANCCLRCAATRRSERLNRELNEIAASPDLATILEPDGTVATAIAPAAFAARMKKSVPSGRKSP